MYAEVLSHLESDERYVSEQVMKMFRVAEGVEDAMRKSHLTAVGGGSFSAGTISTQSVSVPVSAMTDSISVGEVADPTGSQQSTLVGRADSVGRGDGGRGRSTSSAVSMVPIQASGIDVSDTSASGDPTLNTGSLLLPLKSGTSDTMTLSEIASNVNLQKSRLAAIASAPSHVQTSQSHHTALSAAASSPIAADAAKLKSIDLEIFLCDAMMTKCPLANEIRTLYHNLIGKIFINDD